MDPHTPLRRSSRLMNQGALCALVLLLLQGCYQPPPDEAIRPSLLDSLQFELLPNFPERLIVPGMLLADYLDRGKCPPDLCAEKAVLVQNVCAKGVPMDQKVWMGRSGAEPCYCDCPQTIVIQLAIDSVRFARQVHEATFVRDRMTKRVAAWTAWKQAYPDLKPLPPSANFIEYDLPDSVRLRNMARNMGNMAIMYVWTRRDQANWLFDKFQEHYPIFIGDIVPYTGYAYPNSDFSLHFRDWELGEGPDPTETLRIRFPDVFVEHTAVGWELMAFLLAHELAHGIGDDQLCSPAQRAICEGECDHYGANVILRRVFTGVEYVHVAFAAANQLEAFMSDTRVEYFPECGGEIFPDEHCSLNPSISAACGYPPRYCRKLTVQAARLLEPRPQCTLDWITSPRRDCGPES